MCHIQHSLFCLTIYVGIGKLFSGFYHCLCKKSIGTVAWLAVVVGLAGLSRWALQAVAGGSGWFVRRRAWLARPGWLAAKIGNGAGIWVRSSEILNVNIVYIGMGAKPEI